MSDVTIPLGRTQPNHVQWLVRALQGLAFWIGHRRSLYRGYPLSEGSLVAEACNLIFTNLSDDLTLIPECLYRNLVISASAIPGLGELSRADLVICSADAKVIGREGNIASHAKFVIEVKRGKASTKSIDDDIRRLHSFLEVAEPNTRCFLIVVSENYAPKRFVNEGNSIRKDLTIPNCTGYFAVRRTVKAATSFSGHETAHYICLLEVFLKGQKRKKI